MRNILIIVLMFITTHVSADESWRKLWQKGSEFYQKKNYQESVTAFSQALDLMTEEEQSQNPYVWWNKAESEFYLGHYSETILLCEIALKSENLYALEVFLCADRKARAHFEMGDEESAYQTRKQYIEKSPLMPQTEFTENQIIVRNLEIDPIARKLARKDMMSWYCESEKDFHDYDSIWVIDITKKCGCCQANANDSTEKKNAHAITADVEAPDAAKRNRAQLVACGNSCERLYRAANSACDCIAGACKVLCNQYLDRVRQRCLFCCNNAEEGESCTKEYERWKEAYQKEHPGCPLPFCQL